MDLGRPKSGTGRGEGQSRTGRSVSRRSVIRVAGVSAIGGLAGCAGVIGGNSRSPLSVAYKPIFPFLQFLVMDERGYLADLDREVEATNFADQGLNIVSAYSDGSVDVAFIGITPAIRMRHQGVPGRVTAANQTGGFVVLATDTFAELYDEHGPAAFEVFREQEGRPFTFSTFPRGSVAYVLLRQWLDAELGVGTDHVEIESLAGAGPVRRAMLSGDADGALIMEPIPTILEERGAPFRRITHTGAFMSGAPGGVTFMHDSLWEEDRAAATAVLREHVRATRLINDSPSEAAAAVSTALGDKLSQAAAEQAIRSPASNYVSDPGAISTGTAVCIERMDELGQIDDPVSRDELFERSIYDAATEQ